MSNPTQQQQQEAGQQQAPAMTPDMIAAIVRGAMPQQQQQAPRQYSEQELHKMLKRYDVTEDLMAQLWSPDFTPAQRAAIMNQMIRGAVTEAVTTSRYGTEYLVEELLGHLDEPLSYAKDYGQERLFTELYKGHDGLKMFDGVVRQLVGPLSQDPSFPKGIAERATWLRDRITGEIKRSMPQFDPTKPIVEQGGQQQQQQQNGSGPQQPQSAWGHQQSQTNQHQSPPVGAQSPAQTRPNYVPAAGSQGHGGGAGNGATSGGTQPGPGAPTADKPFGF